MKKVSLERYHEAGRSKMKDIVAGLKSMNRGEVIEIAQHEYEDAGIATPLPAYIHQYFRPERNNGRFSVRRLRDHSGWVVLKKQ